MRLDFKNQKQIWRSGAEKFAQFWNSIDSSKEDFLSSDIACVKAIFLKEKPATWNNPFALQYRKQLQKFGIDHQDKWIFDPDQVRELTKRYPSVFPRTRKIDAIIHSADSNEICMGLLLGFPLTPVRRFAFFQSILDLKGPRKEKIQSLMMASKGEKGIDGLMKRILKARKELKLTSTEVRFLKKFIGQIRYVDIQGITWMDMGSSKQSTALQKRLTQALAISGAN